MKYENWGSSRCRTCLCYSSEVTPLHHNVSFDTAGVSMTIVEILKECASMQILLGDSKPQTICKLCMESARVTYLFRKRCKQSQLVLQQEECPEDKVVKLECAFDIDDRYSSEDEKPLATVVSAEAADNRNKSVPRIYRRKKSSLSGTQHEHCCALCSKTFKSLLRLSTHERRHRDPKSKIYWKTEEAGKASNNDSSSLSKEDDKTDCKESDPDEDENKMNKSRRHRPYVPEVQCNADGVYKCSICNRIFTTSRNLLIHSRRHNELNLALRFSKKNKLNSLVNKTTTATDDKPTEVSAPDGINLPETVKEFNCSICNKTFSLHKYLVKHLKRHQATGRLSINNFDKKLALSADYNALGKCCFCDWTGTSNELKKHKEEHAHLKTFQCNLCDKKFFEHYNLQTHLMIHTGEKKHMCDFCGKSFTAKTNLKMHLRTHTGAKPYGCELCEKAFAQQSQLTSHMFTHSQDRNYVCSLCGVTFKRKGSLRDHIRSHRPVEEWDKCSVCSKPFRTQKQLKEHMIQHTGERNHICNICGKDFGRKRNLSTHMKIHSGESPHVCLVCGRAFSQKHVLLSHMKTHEK